MTVAGAALVLSIINSAVLIWRFKMRYQVWKQQADDAKEKQEEKKFLQTYQRLHGKGHLPAPEQDKDQLP